MAMCVCMYLCVYMYVCLEVFTYVFLFLICENRKNIKQRNCGSKIKQLTSAHLRLAAESLVSSGVTLVEGGGITRSGQISVVDEVT